MTQEFCIKCGTRLPERAKFCPECGASRLDVPAREGQEPEPQPPQPTSYERSIPSELVTEEFYIKGKSAVFPPVCVRCLAPADTSIEISGRKPGARSYITKAVSVPFCKECKGNQKVMEGNLALLPFGILVAAFVAIVFGIGPALFEAGAGGRVGGGVPFICIGFSIVGFVFLIRWQKLNAAQTNPDANLLLFPISIKDFGHDWTTFEIKHPEYARLFAEVNGVAPTHQPPQPTSYERSIPSEPVKKEFHIEGRPVVFPPVCSRCLVPVDTYTRLRRKKPAGRIDIVRSINVPLCIECRTKGKTWGTKLIPLPIGVGIVFTLLLVLAAPAHEAEWALLFGLAFSIGGLILFIPLVRRIAAENNPAIELLLHPISFKDFGDDSITIEIMNPEYARLFAEANGLAAESHPHEGGTGFTPLGDDGVN